jgi:hypothetical protein
VRASAETELDGPTRSRTQLSAGCDERRDTPTTPGARDDGARTLQRLGHVSSVDDGQLEHSPGASPRYP